MRLYTAATSLLIFILVPFVASALGLGDISLNSALNEPFSAEIPLESVQQSDLEELTVELASADTFDRYGLDRPAFLNDFSFQVEENQKGQPVISLSSSAPVAEPFVTMLLDVRWSSGRLLREYTVLLDPPLFEANIVQAPATPAQTAAPVASPAEGQVERTTEAPAVEVVEPTGLFQASPETPVEAQAETEFVIEPVPEEEPAVEVVTAAEPEPVVEAEPEPVVDVEPAPAPVVAATPAPLATSYATPESYTTQRGDTLWGISERVRNASGLSNNQMMLALYRANPDAFMGNINRLKAGAILRIPAGAELDAPSQTEATAEVIEQNAEWSAAKGQESRLQLVAPSGTDDSDSAAEAAAESGTTGEVDESAESVAAERELDDQATESERLLQVEDAEMQALQQRIDEQGQLEEGAAETEEQIFADTETAPETGEIPGATTESGDEAEPESAAPAPGSVGASPAEDTSLLGGIFSSLWFWGGVALVLLVAFGLARARKTEPEPVDDAQVDATGSWATDIVEPTHDESLQEEPSHDETIKDFGDLSGDVETDDGPAIFADDPDATHAGGAFDAAEQDDLGASDADKIDDSLIESFSSPSEDVLGDDLDFRVDADDVFASPDAQDASEPQQDASEPQQEAAGQDEVELPLEKTISTGAPLNLDQADPIAEAEFHMAYGLYDQAADLLVRALEDSPDNRLYRVKLLEVYFVWENKDGFLEQARALRSSITDESDSDWNKVLILGKQLCPDDDLFSGADAALPAAESMDLELSDVGETEVDFTLGGGEVQALDLDLDMDVGSSSGDDEASGADADLDFDFGDESSEPASSDELTLNLGDDSDSESTMESPTIESSMDSPTLESPTIESPMDSPTIENPMMGAETDLADTDATMESDTLESSMDGETLESPTLDAPGASSETTEMPGLEDPTSLDVDLSGLTDLPVDSGDLADLGDIDAPLEGAQDATGEQESSEPEFGGDESRMSPETENFRVSDDDAAIFAGLEEAGKVAGDSDFSPEEDPSGSDTVEQPSVDASSGDTAEQPVLDEMVDTGVAEESQEAFSADGEAWSLPEDATMTEVGTKLDLARAYIDMGDPDGARSILNEVLDEGEDTQQQEARQLLAELDD